jgi:hypothetical protein
MSPLLLAGLLFFVLSPGVLLTIPAGPRGLFFSGQTSVTAALVHAVVFMGASYLLMSAYEGFQNMTPMGPTMGPPMGPPGPNMPMGPMSVERFRNRHY